MTACSDDGTDVHNQPKIYIENPAENSHISPYICQLIHFTNYGSRMPKFVGRQNEQHTESGSRDHKY